MAASHTGYRYVYTQYHPPSVGHVPVFIITDFWWRMNCSVCLQAGPAVRVAGGRVSASLNRSLPQPRGVAQAHRIVVHLNKIQILLKRKRK